jgi:hypothetical protein
MPEDLATLALDLTRIIRAVRARFSRGTSSSGACSTSAARFFNGTAASTNTTIGMDRVFFEFAGIDADEFKDFVATGATDEEVAEWIKSKAKVHSPGEIAAWNFTLKCRRISELPPDRQAWVQEYLLANVSRKSRNGSSSISTCSMRRKAGWAY